MRREHHQWERLAGEVCAGGQRKPRPLVVAALALWISSCVETYPDLFTPIFLSAQFDDAGAAGSSEAPMPSPSQIQDAGDHSASPSAPPRDAGVMPFPVTAPVTVPSRVSNAVGGRARPVSRLPEPVADASVADPTAPPAQPQPLPPPGGAVEEALDPYRLPPSQRPLDDASCSPDCNYYGGTCRAGRCVYDCDLEGRCHEEQIYCPPDTPCHVRCGEGSCSGSIVCREGAECTIDCQGSGACAQPVICEGSCQVTCSGTDSCRGGVRGSVEQLTLVCSGDSSCGSLVQCEGGPCEMQCTGANSCHEVLTYGQSNTVQCLGGNACAAGVWCSGGSCSVDCTQGACEAGFVCQAPGCELNSY